MALKPRHKRRIFWGIVSALGAIVLALVIVPPLVNLNYLKPRIENAIATGTGISANINGRINFSLLGGATIAAHDITMPNGTVDSIMFTVPVSKIFDLENAQLSGNIFVYGARIDIDSLIPPKFNNNLTIQDSFVKFKGKDYSISLAELSNGMLRGTVRTEDHKYDFEASGDEFHIKNKANNLDISGRLYSDGSANGTMSIDTDDLNAWFDFAEPRIDRRVKLTMDFDWNGAYGFKFSNIHGDNFDGNIELFDDGGRVINLNARDINFDLSFLLGGTNLFYNTAMNLDLSGNLKFGDKQLKHVQLSAIGTGSEIQIKSLVTDDVKISGGTITADGAQNLPITLPIDGIQSYCLFSGNPNAWKCSEFKYGDMTGSLSVSGGVFEIFVQSDKKMPDGDALLNKTKLLGARGKINFQFSDISGSIDINNKQIAPSYKFAKNKTLSWLDGDLYFLPESMKTTTGDFAWNDSGLIFTPHSGRWNLRLDRGHFVLSGVNAKDWFSGIDMRSVNDMAYEISGDFRDKNISNFEIKIADHLFRGSVSDNNITLRTDLLNIDSFVNQNYIDDYEEQKFLSQEPLLLLFGINANVSLSADTIIHSGNKYANFVYAKKSGTQTFSITDAKRGNMLASITQNKNQFDIKLQLNRFVVADKLLVPNIPFNISNTIITADATLTTFGMISYDIWENLNGKIDMSFDGGVIYGLGVDRFYANTGDITTLNAEYKLSDAIEDGASQIKNLHIVGVYDGGNFTTTAPFALSMRHSDATGTISLLDGNMEMDIALILRGTSPSPAPINIKVLPNGERKYSLSEIMTNFDPDFLRDFVASHDKF